MSIFPKFFFTLFGNALPSWLRSYIARVKGDGGTVVDTGHTKEVYADTYPYEPTLIQSCSGGGSTPQNFAVGSEDISNTTYWEVQAVTATPDAEPNPFGGSGVSLIAETGSTIAKGFYQKPGSQASIVLGQAYTISAYVKKGDGDLAPDIIQVTYLSSGFGSDFYANYNISTGVVAKVNGGFADIQDVGGGWYRISLAGVAVATGALGAFVFAFVNNDPNATRLPSYTGNTSRDVYVWGVQFVQGNEPGQYIKTTTAAIDSIGTLYSIIPSKDLLLYQYTGAAAAYSLRSLSAGTVYVVKVRRSGDNVELDFTAEEVSGGELAAWVRAGGGTEDGFVTTWYDQSGNTNNATQATAANQPKIVSSGTLVTENGKAAVVFDNVDDFMNTSAFTSLSNSSYFIVSQLNIGSGANDYHYLFSTQGAAPIQSLAKWHNDGSANANKRYFFDGTTPHFDGVNSLNQELSSLFFPTSSPYVNLYVNGSAQTFSTTPAPAISISNKYIALGRWDGSAIHYCDGVIQEFIVYASDQSANRTGIEDNINAHYNIYP